MIVISLVSFAQTSAPSPTPFANSDAGEFRFKEETWDFGSIPQGIPVTHTFTFTNVGKVPIIITDVKPSCQCTTPKWPKEPILPGKSAEIDVQYNSLHEGGFDKSCTITSNATSSPKYLHIKGTVLPKEQTTPDKQPSIINATPKN